MADVAVAKEPKEKKKKKSVKEKGPKVAAVAEDGAPPAPQTNGDVVPATPSPAEPAEVEATLAVKKKPKITVAADVSVSETQVAPQSEDQDPEKLSPSKARPKFSWSVEADVENAEADEVKVNIPSKKKLSISPEPEQTKVHDEDDDEEEEEKVEIAQSKLHELAEAFYLLDFDQDGLIDKKDLQLTFSTLGKPDIADEDLQGMLDEAQSPLDFEAFVKLLGFKTIDLDAEETLMGALQAWDPERCGYIPETRIRHDLMTWCDKFSEQEVDLVLEDAPLYDQDQGTMLDYVSFCKSLISLRKKTKPKKQKKKKPSVA